MIKLYKILTFLLQPIGYIILMMSVSTVMLGLGNPQLLLGGAVGICIFLYLFCGFRFLVKAVVGNQPVKAKLKDWIRVNSFVCLIQGVLMLFSVIAVLYLIPQKDFDKTFRMAYDMIAEQTQNANMGSYESFANSMRGMFRIFGVFEIVLLVHVFLSWRMLKGYREYFSE